VLDATCEPGNRLSIDQWTSIASDTVPPTPDARRAHSWIQDRTNWEIAFSVVLIGTSAVVINNTHPLWIKVAVPLLLLAQVPAYLWLGRGVVATEHHGGRPWLYIALVVALYLPATALADETAVSMMGLAPLVFLTLEPKWAVAVLAVSEVVPVAKVVVSPTATNPDLAMFIAVILLGLAFAYFFGSWIGHLITQSRERAELIRELDDTRAELAEVSRYAGALAERQHLAREVHDTLAQGFTSIATLLEAAEHSDDSDKYLTLARDTARENLAEARALVSGSRDEVPLRESLRRTAKRLADSADIAVECRVEGEARPLESTVELMLLRIAQEGLSNIRKHAHARHATVAIAFEADRVRLRLVDDGVGFDPGAPRGGYGLRGMRERVAEAGGELTVDSAVGDGTRVEACVAA
jgi:signal transduction histidine kinase